MFDMSIVSVMARGRVSSLVVVAICCIALIRFVLLTLFWIVAMIVRINESCWLIRRSACLPVVMITIFVWSAAVVVMLVCHIVWGLSLAYQ